MFKPIAIGMLLVTAVSAGAAFAGNQTEPQRDAPWSHAYGDYMSSDWKSVVDEPKLPQDLSNPCAGNRAQCAQFADWTQVKEGRHKPLPAPEVDAAGAMGALTILAALLAMLRGRRADQKGV